MPKNATRSESRLDFTGQTPKLTSELLPTLRFYCSSDNRTQVGRTTCLRQSFQSPSVGPSFLDPYNSRAIGRKNRGHLTMGAAGNLVAGSISSNAFYHSA